mmetsp:Transcript_43062/g.102244  ORF Transcript_43062/g.102244 Transcript_43062/m.102244 type:complete len:203 (+) Transcript_43062:214-822(+)
MRSHGKRDRSHPKSIGLHKFASSKKSTYDKRVVLAKQAALNAKKVNKYKKLLRKLGVDNAEVQRKTTEENPAEPSEGDRKGTRAVRPSVEGVAEEPSPADGAGASGVTAAAGGGAGAGGRRGRQKRPRPKTQLERLSEKAAAEKASTAEERKKAEEERERRQAEKAQKQRARKKTRAKFLSKTRKGQPVMKFRVEKILSKLS